MACKLYLNKKMRHKFENTLLLKGGGSWNVDLPAPSNHWSKAAPEIP